MMDHRLTRRTFLIMEQTRIQMAMMTQQNLMKMTLHKPVRRIPLFRMIRIHITLRVQIQLQH